MASRTRILTRGYPKDKEGNPLCRWCNQIVKKPRRTFCSTLCVHEYLVRSNPEYVREQLAKKSHLCSHCRINVIGITQGRELRSYIGNSPRWSATSDTWTEYEERKALAELFRQYHLRYYQALGFPAKRTWWDADHILEVDRGGGECALDNYQILCYLCHLKKTKEFMKTRNKK